jgi:hypothetical protein
MIIRALRFVLGIGWWMASPVHRRVLTWYHEYLCEHLTLQLSRHLSEQLDQKVGPLQQLLHRLENEVALELDGVVRELARLQMQLDFLHCSAQQEAGAVNSYLSPDEPAVYDQSTLRVYRQDLPDHEQLTSALEGRDRRRAA